MRDRKSVRYLAPIALVGFALGVYLIVQHGLSTKPSTAATTRTSTAGPVTHRGPKYYIVKPGDVLTSIAARTHISLAEIELLNPNVFPNSLQTGQRIRLRR